jgi:hypothetical protein
LGTVGEGPQWYRAPGSVGMRSNSLRLPETGSKAVSTQLRPSRVRDG